jgi:hypothetical protein
MTDEHAARYGAARRRMNPAEAAQHCGFRGLLLDSEEVRNRGEVLPPSPDSIRMFFDRQVRKVPTSRKQLRMRWLRGRSESTDRSLDDGKHAPDTRAR